MVLERHNETVEQRLSLVTIGVDDVARARAFYEALGWVSSAGDDDVVFFQADCMIVALWGRASLVEDSGVTDAGAGGVTLAHNVTSPDAVDRVLAEAAAAGATIARAGAVTSWGGYSGVFLDLDGHPWEIAQSGLADRPRRFRPLALRASNGHVERHRPYT